MTFQERNDHGPEDAPAPERVERLARELWAAGEIRKQLAHYAWADLTIDERERFLELARIRIEAGEERRAVCDGWAGNHPIEPVVYRPGLEPVSHGMCDERAVAFAAGERTTYVRTVVVRDGYQDHVQPLHLCRGPSGVVWGVYPSGYVTWEDPEQGIGPLRELEVRDGLLEGGR